MLLHTILITAQRSGNSKPKPKAEDNKKTKLNNSNKIRVSLVENVRTQVVVVKIFVTTHDSSNGSTKPKHLNSKTEDNVKKQNLVIATK